MPRAAEAGGRLLFETMLDASPGVELHPGVDFKEARARWQLKHLVFTGAVDEFRERRFGAIPITREFPKDWPPDEDPLSPNSGPQPRSTHPPSSEPAARNIIRFTGRPANYRSYHTDQFTGMALTLALKPILRYRKIL